MGRGGNEEDRKGSSENNDSKEDARQFFHDLGSFLGRLAVIGSTIIIANIREFVNIFYKKCKINGHYDDTRGTTPIHGFC
jgi:hypothetical protein